MSSSKIGFVGALGCLRRTGFHQGQPKGHHLSYQLPTFNRLLSSNKNGDGDEPAASADKGEEKRKSKGHLLTDAELEFRTKRSHLAKSRLNSLLQSIVQDQDSRSKEGGGSSKSKPKVDYKLAIPIKEKTPAPTQIQLDAAIQNKLKEEGVGGKEMLKAVKTVAETVIGEPQQTETDLVQKLKSHTANKINLSEIFVGMKIDRSSKPRTEPSDPNLSRAHQVRRALQEGHQRQDRGSFSDERRQSSPRGDRRQEQRQRRSHSDQTEPSYAPIDIFGAPPLGIFTGKGTGSADSVSSYLKTWDALEEKELEMAVSHPPANGFEEMIQWTQQGKLWHYPINNEQGLEEEGKVPFHEHVFLEPQLESWCPSRGPIRHFMDLVCVGLRKNPFLTVQEKKDHLEWYHLYFKNKEQIVRDVGAGEIK